MKKPDGMSEELYTLIMNAESMPTEKEKKYWLDLFPEMKQEQIDRLFNILETERRKLEELELKYQENLKSINWEGHLEEQFKSLSFLKKLKLLIFNK